MGLTMMQAGLRAEGDSVLGTLAWYVDPTVLRIWLPDHFPAPDPARYRCHYLLLANSQEAARRRFRPGHELDCTLYDSEWTPERRRAYSKAVRAARAAAQPTPRRL